MFSPRATLLILSVARFAALAVAAFSIAMGEFSYGISARYCPTLPDHYLPEAFWVFFVLPLAVLFGLIFAALYRYGRIELAIIRWISLMLVALLVAGASLAISSLFTCP